MFSVTSVVETDVAAKECQCIFYRESEIHTFMSKKMPVSLDDKKLVPYLEKYKFKLRLVFRRKMKRIAFGWNYGSDIFHDNGNVNG